ncbi:MAG TPA: BTAD domain-containing putative transcriptional regulator [Gaiellaceae bacterium]|nr:BTAD domain-containing putative transcriptional regulator [Gaiellaceae bacterium]
MDGLEFRVLGPLEIRRDGAPIPATAPKQRALLARLLLSLGEPVPQDELIEALWNGDLPRTARAAFHNQIRALRRLLGPEAVERRAAGYALRAEPDALDLARFRRLAAGARRGPASERAARLRDALALWRGPAFPDLAGDSTTEADRARSRRSA